MHRKTMTFVLFCVILIYVVTKCSLVFFPGMDALRRMAYRLRLRSVSSQTLLTRQKHWSCYLKFCRLYKLPPVPCDIEPAACYISYLSMFMKHSSIVTYFYGVVFYHKLLGFAPPSTSHFYLKSILSGIYREPSAPPTVKDTFRPADLLELQRCVDYTVDLDFLVWVGILILFRSLLRVSHLVDSPHALKRGDVVFKSWGVLLRINSSKTLRNSSPVYIPIVSSRNTPALASLGVPVSDIKIRGLWSSDCVFRYLSPSENRKKLVDSKLAALFP